MRRTGLGRGVESCHVCPTGTYICCPGSRWMESSPHKRPKPGVHRALQARRALVCVPTKRHLRFLRRCIEYEIHLTNPGFGMLMTKQHRPSLVVSPLMSVQQIHTWAITDAAILINHQNRALSQQHVCPAHCFPKVVMAPVPKMTSSRNALHQRIRNVTSSNSCTRWARGQPL